MYKVQNPISSQCYIPSSEPLRIYLLEDADVSRSIQILLVYLDLSNDVLYNKAEKQ
jgi:hypothetical protein